MQCDVDIKWDSGCECVKGVCGGDTWGFVEPGSCVCIFI